MATLIPRSPLRSPLPLAASALLFPLVGEVTRHDMPASIRAGFLPGEMAEALELDPKSWTIREVTTLSGSLRFTASKRQP